MYGPDRKRRSIDTQIDENLRKIFEEDVEQDLPDRLQLLLEALDGASADSDDEDPGDGTGNGGGGAGGSQSGGAPGGGNSSAGTGHRTDARQVAMRRVNAAAPAGAMLPAVQAGPG